MDFDEIITYHPNTPNVLGFKPKSRKHLIKTLFDKYCNYQEVADVLGISRNKLIKIANEEGFKLEGHKGGKKGRIWPKSIKRQVFKLDTKNMTIYDICADLNLKPELNTRKNITNQLRLAGKEWKKLKSTTTGKGVL